MREDRTARGVGGAPSGPALDDPGRAARVAGSVAGAAVETVEGCARGGRLSALQRGFHEKLGSQCGYCTPGMIMAAEGLLRRVPNPDDQEIRAALGGNLCRCTGYVKIIKSVRAAAGMPS